MSEFSQPVEEKPGVPIWVLSFGDMITNLLACFVLLLSMASTQDRTLFNAGLGSFKRVIAQYGLPDWLMGREQRPELEFRKIKYPVQKVDEKKEPDRVIDPDDEMIRKTFVELRRAVQTQTEERSERVLFSSAMKQSFDRPGGDLSELARRQLRTMVAEMTQLVADPAGGAGAGRNITVYIVGLAVDAPGGQARWIESARRARQADDVFRRAARQARAPRAGSCTSFASRCPRARSCSSR